MESKGITEELHREIEEIPCDIKAEALMAFALKHGLPVEDFMVAYNSFFYREYSKDIIFCGINEDAGKKRFLQLYLTRSGIYDQLPEGLFYQPDRAKHQPFNAANMAAEYKINKQKEQGIRRFFMPFENELFLQGMQSEIEEARLLQGFQSGILNEHFIKFWGISPLVQQSLAIPLICLLPYANTIAGNPDLTGRSLQIILNEQVSVRKISSWVTEVQSGINELGEQRLGVNMVSGWQFCEDHTVMKFTIGPLKNSKVTDYLEGGSKAVFLQTFYSFFVPAEAETVTVIEVANHDKHMVLQSEEKPVLGYTSTL